VVGDRLKRESLGKKREIGELVGSQKEGIEALNDLYKKYIRRDL